MKEIELLYLLNNLDHKGLISLRGIGAVMASRILTARPFKSLVEFENVSGVTFGLIRKLLKINASLYRDFLL